MTSTQARALACGLRALLIPVLVASSLQAQRVVLPEGSVIIVKTTTPLESANAQVGQTFDTVVSDTIRIDAYTAIPAGSKIRGVVTYAKPADRQNSGVMEVKFDRLTLTDGTMLPLRGKLTSTDAAERKQIESSADPRVVLVGGRGGIGAAIAGASPAKSLLGALGSLLSEAQDVNLPAGTPLAVQLDQRLALSRRGIARADDFTIYTGEERIRAAQQMLARENYYRGAVNGQLNDATRRALFAYQIDKGLTATGNLDGRTAQALGLVTASAGDVALAGAMLSASEASQLRQSAQSLVARHRQDLYISPNGRLDPRRTYAEADLELWFALSAFADNTSVYEQLVRMSGSTDGAALAGKSLITAARRVDAALQTARITTATQNEWSSIRSRLTALDSNYR